MDDLDDLQESEFVTDTDDQDSLDEKIESEQRLRNHQLWASFQNAACCITELYKDRAQPNISPWIPFQNAASNLTSLYKDCIESQKRFAKLGYQIGRRKRIRDLNKLLKKHKLTVTAKQLQAIANDRGFVDSANSETLDKSSNNQNVSSILAVNQLNIDCDESPSNSMQMTQVPLNQFNHRQAAQNLAQVPQQAQLQQQQQTQNQQLQQQSNFQVLLGNNEDHLLTFQQALSAQAPTRGVKTTQIRRSSSNLSGSQLANRAIDHKSEEDKLVELNQFLADEYHRHVGSRKRSCSNLGGGTIKRFRE